VYYYYGVSQQMFNELVEADSVGGYFNDNIRDEFKTKKVKDAQSATA